MLRTSHRMLRMSQLRADQTKPYAEQIGAYRRNEIRSKRRSEKATSCLQQLTGPVTTICRRSLELWKGLGFSGFEQ